MMGSIASKLMFGCKVLGSMGWYMVHGWNKEAYIGDSSKTGTTAPMPTFLSNQAIIDTLTKLMKETGNLDKLSNDALVKICRQLEYFYTQEKVVDEKEMLELAKFLVDQSIWYHPLVEKSAATVSPDPELFKSKVPKVRFGKTELQISIITCGGMRLQNSWLPDNIPMLSPNRDFVLKSPPQKNIKDCIKHCMKLGINHFETARMYGTSEYQITEALFELMEEGEIKREDFILQTKISRGDKKTFMKSWDATWSNVGEKLGYVDLFAIHAVADIDEKLEESIAICKQLQKEGKIRHIGFSTHGSSEQIMALINTEYVSVFVLRLLAWLRRAYYFAHSSFHCNHAFAGNIQFDYVNIHEHYFGSYHGSGTPNTVGGQGNLACVKRALELDMGLFQISPVDKGGKLYRPSQDVVSLVGRELTPIAFVLLYGWKEIGFHTTSVGVARPSDLDEVLQAARMMALSNSEGLFKSAKDRLNERAVERLGAGWGEKGLVNLPSFLDESTDGIAIGHILWLYNLLVSYGMYEYCHDRYQSLVNAAWNKKKSFQENADAM
jgi:predicted aldo/keto reductase-like oxidoreductase